MSVMAVDLGHEWPGWKAMDSTENMLRVINLHLSWFVETVVWNP